jgi:hypothetical protein
MRAAMVAVRLRLHHQGERPMAIYRNINGTWTLITADAAVAAAAESFGFGVEREMKESGEKRGTEDAVLQDATLTANTATAEHTAEDWFVADSFSFGVEREMRMSNEKGLTDAAGADTSGRQFDSFVVTFDRPVDPLDAGQPITFTATVGGPIYGERGDDLATDQPDTVMPESDQLLYTWSVTGGTGTLSLPAYGLFLA